MCGITGYVGGRDAVETAVSNLRRLDYRGYDSAGVAYSQSGGAIQIVKAAGKIAGLQAQLAERPGPSSVAVAHTRWATHGSPTQANAHPHADCTGTLAVVHNGIVENHAELRDELRSRGHEFASETDTEVIAHLIEEELSCGEDRSQDAFLRAVRSALLRVRGSFAVAIVAQLLGDRVVVARQDSPLIIGLGNNENFLASDIPGVMAYTRRVIVLENGDGAIIGAHDVSVFRLADGKPIRRDIIDVTWDDQAAEKEGYEHFMLKEIHEAPRTAEDTLRGRLADDGRVTISEVERLPLDQIERCSVVACGTAYHAGLVGKRMIESVLRMPVEATVASEFRYSDPLVDARTLTVLISQSGETADTLAALRQAKALGSPTLAVVNVVGSTLSREADAVLYTQAGPEIGVASTKAYIAQVVALGLLLACLAQSRGTAAEPVAEMVAALRALPGQLTESLARSADVEHLAGELATHSSFFFLGRGYDHAAAMEAALKLKEISYIHAEAYAAGEMKHGPLALVVAGVAVVGLCTQAATHEKMISNLQEAHARAGTVIAVLPDGVEPPACAEHVLHVPRTVPALMPATALVAMQLLAYHVARLRGCPIDQPRNLAKSVTVE